MKWGLVVILVCLGGCGPSPAESVTHARIMPGTRYQTDEWTKVGAEAGPVVMVIGGVHGDETAGYKAADKLRDWKITKGTLVLIPEAHKVAISHRARGYPGNMNALFPGDPKGTDMQRLANAIWERIKLARPGLLITLHESRDFHSRSPEHFGQTLTYDFDLLTPLMQRALARANPAITPARHRFTCLVRPFPTCPTYTAWKWLRVPATSIETARPLPLETRVKYQLMVLMGFFDEVGLGYEQSDVPALPSASQPPATDLATYVGTLFKTRPGARTPERPQAR